MSGALVQAASTGAAPIITMLLDAGADVNGLDRHTDTALAMARRVNNAEIATLLLARGARESSTSDQLALGPHRRRADDAVS